MNEEEMKEIVWCFRYVKETTCTENYKLTYDLWKQRNRNSRRNTDAKLLLNQKNYILKKKLQILKFGDNKKHQGSNAEDQAIEEESNTLTEENSRDQKPRY
jgi:hypothetical protein